MAGGGGPVVHARRGAALAGVEGVLPDELHVPPALTARRGGEERGIETPFKDWLQRWDATKPERITTSIEVADFIAARTAALKAHRTQVDPEGQWFSIPDELIAEIYPYEDFRLAYSEVWTDKPESDLFDGL